MNTQKTRDPQTIISGHLVGNFSDDETLEKPITDIMKTLLPYCDLFVDVGANVGYYTLLASKYMERENAKIYSFEPDDILYKYLKDITSTKKNIEVFSAAISNSKGKDQFFVSDLPRSGSLHKISDEHFPIVVDITTIDEVLKDVSVSKIIIKIDVEGGELKVLEGAIETLQKIRPILFIEIHAKFLELINKTPIDVFEFLNRYNYMSIVIYSSRIVAVPREKISLNVTW